MREGELKDEKILFSALGSVVIICVHVWDERKRLFFFNCVFVTQMIDLADRQPPHSLMECNV